MPTPDLTPVPGTDEMIALLQITPPYDWHGWAETLAAIRDLPEVVKA